MSEAAKQTLGETKQSEVNSGNSSADLPNSAKVANGNKSPELNSSDGWDYKGKPNGIDTYGKTYNRKDVFNTIDDSGALNLMSEFTLPWDAAAWTFPKAVSDNSFWSQELKRLGSHNAR